MLKLLLLFSVLSLSYAVPPGPGNSCNIKNYSISVYGGPPTRSVDPYGQVRIIISLYKTEEKSEKSLCSYILFYDDQTKIPGDYMNLNDQIFMNLPFQSFEYIKELVRNAGRGHTLVILFNNFNRIASLHENVFHNE